jgi:hypothetical protein
VQNEARIEAPDIPGGTLKTKEFSIFYPTCSEVTLAADIRKMRLHGQHK